MELFLEVQENQNLLHIFTAGGFQLKLAYLVDIFTAFNLLNQHLQDSHTCWIDHYDSILGLPEPQFWTEIFDFLHPTSVFDFGPSKLQLLQH